MRPKIIMHNTISLDGSLTQFTINMELHYHVLGTFNADAHIIGSNTAKTGLDMFLDTIPPEAAQDKKPPILEPSDTRPYWILIDSHAQMYHYLHIFRQFDYCKDVIVLITPQTPQKYIDYLTSRHYHIIKSGKQHVDLKQALKTLSKEHQIKTIITDTGHTLNSQLLKQGLLDEISLIISPEIVGKTQLNVFKSLTKQQGSYQLKLINCKPLKNNHIHLHYKILKKSLEGISK